MVEMVKKTKKQKKNEKPIKNPKIQQLLHMKIRGNVFFCSIVCVCVRKIILHIDTFLSKK